MERRYPHQSPHLRSVFEWIIEKKTFYWLSLSKQATAEASILIAYNECMDQYTDTMQNASDAVQPYFDARELLNIHLAMKDQAMEQVWLNPFY